MKILLIEDDATTTSTLAEALTRHDYTVNAAVDAQIGLKLAKVFDYDLILLDIKLPKLDGTRFCRKLREEGCQKPIMLLGAKDSNADRVKGLEAGADDYVVKPYKLPELMDRIGALVRRGSSTCAAVLSWEKLRLDPDMHEVTYGGKPIHLTPKEFSLLELFLGNHRRIFSRSELREKLWSLNECPGKEAVTTHIKSLRQKLRAAGITTNLIETVYKLGYRLKPAPESGKINSEIATVPPIKIDHSQTEAKVMAMVAEIWKKYKGTLIEKVALFEQVGAQLINGTLDSQLQRQAKEEAHKLAGSLGCFGLPEGSKVARQIEHLLQDNRVLAESEVTKLEELVRLLKQELEKQPFTKTSPFAFSGRSPHLLVVDDDVVVTERLKVEALAWGLQAEVATDLTAARKAIGDRPPNVILLDISFPNTKENGLTLLAELAVEKPEIPVLIFSSETQLSYRIEVARLGAAAFLQKSIPTAEIFQAIITALNQKNTIQAKVMVVDDDPNVLSTISSLLSTWGLQVTTLQDTQIFWEVLEATTPELLILDLEMPDYSGTELCQVVRNDSRWSQLPILLLSERTNDSTVHQVFTVGADDYVSKPIVEPELIARILNRLELSQIRRKLEQVKLSNLNN